MVPIFSVCILGPKGGGKSALLQTCIDCVANDAHGYGRASQIFINYENLPIEVWQQIPRSEYSELIDEEQFEVFRDDFATRNKTETDDVKEYLFRLTAQFKNRSPQPEAGQSDEQAGHVDSVGSPSNPLYLRVVDAPGKFGIPQRFRGSDRVESVGRKRLLERLKTVDAAIVVVPLVDDIGTSTFHPELKTLIADLTIDSRNQMLKRVVVAFTQYERLFMQVGRSAFIMALNRKVGQKIVRRAVQQGDWASALSSFSQQPGRSVHFALTSSYGFVKDRGLPNIDPHVSKPSDMRLFGDEPRMNALWRPFLTADPFVCAALDRPGHLTFTFADIFPKHDSVEQERPQRSARPEPPPRAAGPTRPPAKERKPGPSLWKWGVNFLNKNRAT